jgi:predicted ATPase
LRQAAPPDGVVIAASTRRLVGRLFDCHEIEPVLLEDGVGPAPAFRVVEPIAGATRFEALRAEGMSSLVGREAEMERLGRFWASARRGAGQVTSLSGETGIGKSRLATELRLQLSDELHVALRCSGSPFRSATPMAALLDAVQTAARFAPGDSPARRTLKLGALFASLGRASVEAKALIASLLGLPFVGTALIKDMSPQKRKERAFALLLERVERAAAERPILAIVEDAHWLDPTSLEFLTLLVDRAGKLRLWLLVVGRPEFAPPWPDYSYVSTLVLSRLSRSDAALLIHEVSGDRAISAPLEDEIVSRADGVPLFVEELTKSVLERPLVAAADGAGAPGARKISPAIRRR